MYNIGQSKCIIGDIKYFQENNKQIIIADIKIKIYYLIKARDNL